MSSIFTNWNKEEKSPDRASAGEMLRSTLRSPQPFKPRLESADRQIRIQIAKLAEKSEKLSQTDSATFQKVVSFIEKKDVQRAKIHANELTEIRKMQKFVVQARLAFEQIELRLNTISDLGDATSSLSSAIGVIKGVAPGLYNIIPESQGEIEEISTLISGMLIDSRQADQASINIETANEEAEGIIAEAGVVAEKSILDKFPELPTSLGEPTDSLEEAI